MVYITRKSHFSASHRLFNPSWSMEKNDKVYGKCNNPNGHGHNYDLEVTVVGKLPKETGMVMDLKKLADIMEEEIVDKVDHKHLNHDVPFLKDVITTAEIWPSSSGRSWSQRSPRGSSIPFESTSRQTTLLNIAGSNVHGPPQGRS